MAKLLNIRIEKAGLQSLIVDMGEPSLMDRAVPIGGALDLQSANLANILVGNPPKNELLEISMFGPTLSFDAPCILAISGANLSPTLNGEKIPLNQRIFIHENDSLSFGKIINGCRAYLAIGGTWKSKARSNGLAKPPLKKGEFIQVFPSLSMKQNSSVEIEIPTLNTNPPITVFPGPEFHSFSREYLAFFFSRKWRVSLQSNRMGLRLEAGQAPEMGIKEIISSPVLPGTIQVSGSGQPLVLLADAQTTGGYPRLGIASVNSLGTFGQLKPGDFIEFRFEEGKFL